MRRAAPPTPAPGPDAGGGGTRGEASGRAQGGASTAPEARPFVAAPRQATSRDVLTLRWTYPVYVSEAAKAQPTTGSTARLVRKALPREQAFSELVGDDPRPLLVMRECDWCEGTDDALLNKRLDNERTVLMSHWFHAVKLPNHVLEDDHPFRNLFPEDDVPHLFMATRDGQHVVGLDGQQSPVELWEAMDDVLEEAGVRNPEKALKKVTKVLDQFDRLDIERQRLRSELDLLLEEHGPKSGKVKKVAKKLAKADEERDDLIAELEDLTGAHVTAELSG